MDIGSAFVVGVQSLEGVQPDEAAFDHPALAAEAGAVGVAAAGDPRSDAVGAQQATYESLSQPRSANSFRGPPTRPGHRRRELRQEQLVQRRRHAAA